LQIASPSKAGKTLLLGIRNPGASVKGLLPSYASLWSCNFSCNKACI